MFKKIYNRFINSGKHSRTRCSLAALTSALFIAFRMFPTVSVKALASILPNFLYKAPKHTTAALKQHLHRKQSHDQKGWWYRHLNTMKNVTIQTFPILGGSAFYGGSPQMIKFLKLCGYVYGCSWVCACEHRAHKRQKETSDLPWSWSYRHVWAAWLWVLGIQARSSGRAVHTLHHWAISPPP